MLLWDHGPCFVQQFIFFPVDSDEEDEENESHSSREVKMLEGKELTVW